MRQPGSRTGRLAEEYLGAAVLRPELLTLGSNGAMKQAARIGLGVALLSRVAVELELELGLLATIRPRGGLPRRAWFVVRPAVGPVSAATEEFVAFVTSPAARIVLSRDRAA